MALLPSRGDGGLACRLAWGPGLGAAHRLRGGLHRLDDVHVAGTAAQVAFQASANLVFGRVWILVQEIRGGHDETGCAVSALQAVLVPESLLERVQLTVFRHALDRREVPALGLDGEHGAAFNGLPVHQDRARAERARVTADVGADKADDVPQIVDEQQPGLDLMLLPVPVDGGCDLVFDTLLLRPLPARLPAPGELTALVESSRPHRSVMRADPLDQTATQSNAKRAKTATLLNLS